MAPARAAPCWPSQRSRRNAARGLRQGSCEGLLSGAFSPGLIEAGSAKSARNFLGLLSGYLNRLGFTPQRPLKRAYERDPKAVEQWLKTDYPALAARAKTEGGEIYWGDETAASSVEHYPRGYAPKGKTPVLVLSQSKRQRVNIISAISNQGTVRFMLYRETLAADVLIKFLRRLIKDAGRKVFLVLDNLRVHHSRKVRAWLEDKTEQIELHFLPSYAPDLNPDEYLNCDLKARLSAAEPVRKPGKMHKKVLSHLRSIQKDPERVRSYFQNEYINYAA